MSNMNSRMRKTAYPYLKNTFGPYCRGCQALESEKELDDFFDSLNTLQLNKIRNFFDTMPVLKHTVKYTCETCGEEKETTVQGINSFFG